jgi:nitrogen fixation protein NifU and related proteins
MSELRELYQEVILEHSKHPRNFHALETANHRAEGFNPLCGDRFTVYVDVQDGAIHDIAFQGSGCAISKASASMMTQTLKGKSEQEAESLFTRFHDLVTGNGGAEDQLGKLAVFSGVSEFPLRVKCATLAWHALRAALRGEQAAVSTE